jgi:ABC-2 type transport system permease protein
MIRLTRIELLKLTTIKLGYGLLGTAAGLTVLFSLLEASRAGDSKGEYATGPLYTVSGFDSVANGGIWMLLLAAVLGVTMSTGEFRHHTATGTYLAVPARARVLGAKIAAGVVAGMVFGLAGFVISSGSALGFTAAHGYRIPVSDLTLARFGAGSLLAGALMAAIGVCVGALVKSQLAATIGVLVWATVVESIIGGLFHSVWPYLPYTAATTVSGLAIGGAAFGPAHGAPAVVALPFFAAAALVAAVAAAFAIVASRTTVRADIT